LLKEGDILEDRYKITDVIGKGGTSIVYRAADLRASGALRAVKAIRKNSGMDAFNAMQEAELIKEFYQKDAKNSFFPNINEIIDNDPEMLYIVQDYINGCSMDKLLADGPFDYKTVLRYAREICNFMSFIHKCKLIHSDMKPDNIMVVKNGDDFENTKNPDRFGKLKFIDFGSVIQLQNDAFAYTPAYAAPEQFNEQKLDERTDIFNMGATFYHMLTGKKPMNVSVNGKYVPSAERFVFDKKINAGLARIIRKCVNDDMDKRYSSCEELLDDLNMTENHTYVRLTGIIAGISAVLLAFSAFSGHMAKKNMSTSISWWMEKAKNASTYEEKSAALEDVIDFDGSYADAYLDLIELYKNDMVFDAAETEQLLRLMNENVNEIKTSPGYEEVSYETGILYWYYYFYGNDTESRNGSTTGKIASVKWFGEAQTENFRQQNSDKYDIASVYCTIGDFYIQTQKKENELLKKNYSADLWESMNSLCDLVEEANAGSDIILLETYKTLVSLENTNMNDFAQSGISFDEQRRFIDDIKNKAEKINAAENSAVEAKEYILRNYDMLIQSIEGSQ